MSLDRDPAPSAADGDRGGQGSAIGAATAHAPALKPARADVGAVPRATITAMPRSEPKTSPGTVPTQRGKFGPCEVKTNASGNFRARPPQGRWPPATPRRGARFPYDLTEPALVRVMARPRREQWDPEEPLTLYEAVAVLFPEGPIVVATLRTARRQGRLDTVTVAARVYTTIGSVRAMTRPVPLQDQTP